MLKLQVMVSDELAERIDKLSDYIGSSRSSVCAAILAKAIGEWEKVYAEYEELEKDSESENIK